MSTRFSMEQYGLRDNPERDVVDASIEDTRPASVPPSTGAAIRMRTDEGTVSQAEHDVPGTQPDEDVPDEETPPEPSPGEPPEEKGPRLGSFK